MCLGIGPMRLEIGCDGIDLFAEILVDTIDLFIQCVDLEVAEFNIFFQFCTRFTNLTAKNFIPFKYQIELTTNIFQ